MHISNMIYIIRMIKVHILYCTAFRNIIVLTASLLLLDAGQKPAWRSTGLEATLPRCCASELQLELRDFWLRGPKEAR